MLIDELSHEDWEQWANNPVTKSYFGMLENDFNRMQREFYRINSDSELSRKFYTLKGTCLGVENCIHKLDVVLEALKEE
ncbi:MAG: hypothetical protein O2963_00190 [Proteobacteria bacterium]|nr:hypothetical protein [Pseudomonadota bacterium]